MQRTHYLSILICWQVAIYWKTLSDAQDTSQSQAQLHLASSHNPAPGLTGMHQFLPSKLQAQQLTPTLLLRCQQHKVRGFQPLRRSEIANLKLTFIQSDPWAGAGCNQCRNIQNATMQFSCSYYTENGKEKRLVSHLIFRLHVSKHVWNHYPGEQHNITTTKAVGWGNTQQHLLVLKVSKPAFPTPLHFGLRHFLFIFDLLRPHSERCSSPTMTDCEQKKYLKGTCMAFLPTSPPGPTSTIDATPPGFSCCPPSNPTVH